jgi:NADH-quinone oxidoreductase subunit G
MGPETAILVVASDLHEEAPIWWLRVKQAAERGAKLIVANPRPTRLDKWAAHTIRYPYGAEAATVLAMLNTLSAKRPEIKESGKELVRSPEVQAAGKALAEAENAVVIFGSEGTSLLASQALAQACSNLLVATNHVGRPNNGLLGVWTRANDQGAWDMGFRPQLDLHSALQSARVLYVVAADPVGDDPALIEAMQSDFVVVQELFLTSTAKLADVVLPVQSYTEREGSLTSGERRVQRYYPAVPERPGSLADFAITARIAQRLGGDLEGRIASKVFIQLAAQAPAYAGLTYVHLSQVEEQWPIVGRGDMYYGGTTYENKQGLGVQLPLRGQAALTWPKLPEAIKPESGLLAVPVTRLYDRGQTLLPSRLLHQRIPEPYVALNRQDAVDLKIEASQKVQVFFDGAPVLVDLHLDDGVPAGTVLVPRSLGIPINGPAIVKIRAAERLAA